LPVLFAGVKEHELQASTENVTGTVMFQKIVCLLSDSDAIH
jgi:hypothetical protein